MIREAMLDDLHEAVKRAEQFHGAWAMSDKVSFDPVSMANTIAGMIDSSDGVVFLSDNGILGALAYPMYLNADFRVAQEIFWFCDGHDEGLRDEFEEWARRQGAQAVIMCFVADHRGAAMERLYRMRGYRKMETQVMKDIV